MKINDMIAMAGKLALPAFDKGQGVVVTQLDLERSIALSLNAIAQMMADEPK